MAGSVTKQLTCPACAVVIGTAVYRRWTPRLTVTSVDGRPTPPESVALLLLRAKADLAAGRGGAAAEARVAFLERNITELVFDFRCRNGHSTLRTMPQVVRATRRHPGQWVDLSS